MDFEKIARLLFIASQRESYYRSDALDYYDHSVMHADIEAWDMFEDLRQRWIGHATVLRGLIP